MSAASGGGQHARRTEGSFSALQLGRIPASCVTGRRGGGSMESKSPQRMARVGTLPSPAQGQFIHSAPAYPVDSTVTGLGLYRHDSHLSQGLCRHILIIRLIPYRLIRLIPYRLACDGRVPLAQPGVCQPLCCMGDVNRLILHHGVEAARAAAATKADRMAVDAAAELFSEEESRLGITHAGFAMTSLPHKKITETVWRRESPRTTLLVEAGRDRLGNFIGVPYGGYRPADLALLANRSDQDEQPRG